MVQGDGDVVPFDLPGPFDLPNGAIARLDDVRAEAVVISHLGPDAEELAGETYPLSLTVVTADGSRTVVDAGADIVTADGTVSSIQLFDAALVEDEVWLVVNDVSGNTLVMVPLDGSASRAVQIPATTGSGPATSLQSSPDGSLVLVDLAAPGGGLMPWDGPAIVGDVAALRASAGDAAWWHVTEPGSYGWYRTEPRQAYGDLPADALDPPMGIEP